MSQSEYALAWTTASRRALIRLPEKAATAVVEFLYGSLAASPHRVGKPLKLGLEGLHSARRGDYRVIYRIDDLAPGHRHSHRASLRHIPAATNLNTHPAACADIVRAGLAVYSRRFPRVCAVAVTRYAGETCPVKWERAGYGVTHVPS